MLIKVLTSLALRKVINHLIGGGVSYLVVLGTTGETATLSHEEQIEIITAVRKFTAERIPLVLGAGGNDTSALLKKISRTDLSGFDAILSVSPYYSKPSQKGIISHYTLLSKESPLPIILYNVPGRTGSNMTAQTTLSLARECEGIIGIKEASGNMEQCMRIIRDKPDNFRVISGDDALTLPLIYMGMDGVISVAAHAEPAKFSEMVRLGLDNNVTESRMLHYELLEMMTMIFEEGNPGGIKALLALKGLCHNELRLPLEAVSKELEIRLASL